MLLVRAIQIGLFPLAVLGYVLFVLRLIAYARHSRVSTTVLASFYTRWMQHQLGTRQDEACARLMLVLPYVSHAGLWLVSGPTLLAHRLTGYVPRIYRYPFPGRPAMRDQPAARTTFYDAALQRHLPSVEQVVILGAGLDTRAYRRRSRARVRWFEVDTPQTQAFKREMLRRAGVDASGVTFVPADFERQDWFELLLSAGFRPDKPTFFIWESVTMYLDAEAVERTLRQVASTAEGTAIAFDYFSPEQLEDRSAFMRYARAVLKAVGEPFGRFGLDPGGVGAYLESCGLAVEEQRTFGQPTGRKPAPAGFVTAVVTRRPETADRSAHSY